ncbi:MAG: FliM/FliN family flagellar motor switch protein [Acidobacteria bacterium]|nr:FliM/FliN family flagellar motor switch protein [Acidobacteriota bacterium]
MTSHVSADGLRAALAAQCRAAVETAIERPLTSGPAAEAAGAGWSTPVAVSGVQQGTLTVWFEQAGALALANAMLGLDEEPEPTVVADMLRQLWAQAAAAVAADRHGLTLVAGSPTAAAAPAAAGEAWMDGALAFGVVAVTGDVRDVRVAPSSSDGDRPAAYPGNLASILEVDLPLVARFARTEMPLRALAQLGPGSMVDMGRSPEAPVQLLVGGQVIAEGEVVVVKGNYGVRITSLVSPDDRLKAIQL